MNNLANIGRWLLPAIAYGDAFGLPYETAKMDPARKVQQLAPVTQNKYVGHQKTGTWSDDTHLSLATAVSLIESNGFNMRSQVNYHVMAYDLTMRDFLYENENPDLMPAIHANGEVTSWGRGTTTAVHRLKLGVSHDQSGGTNMHGNGVLMKMAPLVYWQLCMGIPAAECAKQIGVYTRMTHDNTNCVLQSQLWAETLRAVYDGEKIEMANFDLENDFPKRGFDARETLHIVRLYFNLEPNFPANIQKAITFGGDSDSICSMLGALSVFAGTFSPPEDIKQLHDYARLTRVSERLSQFAK